MLSRVRPDMTDRPTNPSRRLFPLMMECLGMIILLYVIIIYTRYARATYQNMPKGNMLYREERVRLG